MSIKLKEIYASGMNEHDLKNIARKLRNNMTPHELMLWRRIRKKQILGLQFYRQKRIAGYIVDFYCAEKSLILEIDGNQHHSQENIRYDQTRSLIFHSKGLVVLRFDNLQIEHDMGSVVCRITSWVEGRSFRAEHPSQPQHPSQPPF
jgi:very-short-patch-repair endonuclease